MGKRVTFAELEKWLRDHWGLQLRRCDPNSRGRWSGCWKTGFEVSGQFPGQGYTWRHFRTLKAAAKASQYNQTSEPS